MNNVLPYVLKALFILASLLGFSLPYIFKYLSFKNEIRNRTSHRRFRFVLFSLLYAVALTVTLITAKELHHWINSLSIVQKISSWLSVSARTVYGAEVIVALAVNIATGFLFTLFCGFVGAGLKKGLSVLNKKNKLTFAQKTGRKIVRFFYAEKWFLAGNIIFRTSVFLIGAYCLFWAVFLAASFIDAGWFPFDFLSNLFEGFYIYPVITLIPLFEAGLFLKGIEALREDNPDIIPDESLTDPASDFDPKVLADKISDGFGDYYSCEFDASKVEQKPQTDTHHPLTLKIAKAAERDLRYPQPQREVYLECLDRFVGGDRSVIINGSLFSGFSAYFLRYISTVLARGENILFVCNSDSEIDEVHGYVQEGICDISGLYTEREADDNIPDFRHPVWKSVGIKSGSPKKDKDRINECSILVTSLNYLCSDEFEAEHGDFFKLLDSVVFVDAYKTANISKRQLVILNTRIKTITANNERMSFDFKENPDFRVRYMSGRVKYYCFDDTGTSGLDKYLKNILHVDFESVDAMHFNSEAVVRCFNFDGKYGDGGIPGKRWAIQTGEVIGIIMSVAEKCLQFGAPNVTVFTDDSIPYSNYLESLAHGSGQGGVITGDRLRINKLSYGQKDYSVLICVDSGNNLPAAVRRYLSMVSEKPVLILIFSHPYLMRDYFSSHLAEVWDDYKNSIVKIEKNSAADAAERIITAASAGGISTDEILQIASTVDAFAKPAGSGDYKEVLKECLASLGIRIRDELEFYRYFDFVTYRDFDENGDYFSADAAVLRPGGNAAKLLRSGENAVLEFGRSVSEKTRLLIPVSRISQNYIARQNLLYNGKTYYIESIDRSSGVIRARLASFGINTEEYEYLQKRKYRVKLPADPEKLSFNFQYLPKEDGFSLSGGYVSFFRAPAEVLTEGYYKKDPDTKLVNWNRFERLSPSEAEAVRRVYAWDISGEESDAGDNGAYMMMITVEGIFGEKINQIAALASVLLNGIINLLYPSVADSTVVCPVFRGDFGSSEAAGRVLRYVPELELSGADLPKNSFSLLIIEDSPTDLGVLSSLESSGSDAMEVLFSYVHDYLEWYLKSGQKSRFLWFGMNEEPDCFDFSGLSKLSSILKGKGHSPVQTGEDYSYDADRCEFCGSRFLGSGSHQVQPGERRMCPGCMKNIVGNSRKIHAKSVELAKLFIKSSYGIHRWEAVDFIFEPAKKIEEALNRNAADKSGEKIRTLYVRGTDAPFKSYVEESVKKPGLLTIHAEYSIPEFALVELIVRELTHVWQLKTVPNLEESLAEGQIALVAIQYLNYINRGDLALFRERTLKLIQSASLQGYLAIVSALQKDPGLRNNPFKYIASTTGDSSGEITVPPTPRWTELRDFEKFDFGTAYRVTEPDRAIDAQGRADPGKLRYFYRDRLTDSCKKAYDAILDGARRFDATVGVENVTSSDIYTVCLAVLYDHPEIFWMNQAWLSSPNVVSFIYGTTEEDARKKQKQISEQAVLLTRGIDRTMSAYDAALRLYVKIIMLLDYDTIALDKQKAKGGPARKEIDRLRTLVGALIDKKAVCEGYARALVHLLQLCGIEAAEVVGDIHGDGIPHAWCVAKIDGSYYYLDPTWDDRSNTVQKVRNRDISLNYFCVTTEEILRTRSINGCPVQNQSDLPVCADYKGNFYYHNSLILNAPDIPLISGLAVDAARKKKKYFTFKCFNKNVFDNVFSLLFRGKKECGGVIKAAQHADRSIAGGYTYVWNEDIFTITVFFNYNE